MARSIPNLEGRFVALLEQGLASEPSECDEACDCVPSLAKRGKDRMGVLDCALSLILCPHPNPPPLRKGGGQSGAGGSEYVPEAQPRTARSPW